jgi:glycosyltransferase involved in cell wall biosynthesis
MSSSENEGEPIESRRSPSTVSLPSQEESIEDPALENPSPRLDAWPSIDVVIPTFNCETHLRRCLQAVRNQLYDGRIEIIVVDGGSTDGTLEVARELGSRIYVNRGQYATGLTGARHFGELAGTSDIIWCLDSDNFVLERFSAQSLATPFVQVGGIVFTVPVVAPDPEASPFSNWFALDEIEEIGKLIRQSIKVSDYWVTEDMTYGLSNACMIRRNALMAVGGYDSDVRLLQRLRKRQFAKAAIVPRVRFYHDQTAGVLDYRRKWLKRLTRFGSLTDSDLVAYFKDSPTSSRASGINSSTEIQRIKRGVFDAPLNFTRTGDSTWLAGLAYLPALISVIARHPFTARRVMTRFL